MNAKRFLPNQHHIDEIKRINARRGEGQHVRWIAVSDVGDALESHPPGVIFDHSGLALSGGGIRSAAFCLGAVQALAADNKLDAIDYLSTVSGGGYIGCSLTAFLSETGAFPFAAKTDVGARDDSSVNDLQDSIAVQHIRDYSNYLMPRGFIDLVLSIGVVLRGLVASASLVIGPMLLLAALATWVHPTRENLQHYDAFGIPIDHVPAGRFILSFILASALVVFLFVWALQRSLSEARGTAPYEFASRWPWFARFLLLLTCFAWFIEVQPFAVLSLSGSDSASTGFWSSLFQDLVSWVGRFAAVLAPISGVIAFFAGRLGEIIKAKSADPTRKGQLAKLASQALLLVAAIIIPVLLWIGWLYFVWWGMQPDGPSPLTYFGAGGVLFLLSLLMEPNANSLHRLYRDRLSDAFLFLTQGQEEKAKRNAGAPIMSRTRRAAQSTPEDRACPLDRLKLSELRTDRAPYLLINTALNIQGSAYVNKRGRNADFFLFSRDYVGSHATGYIRTAEMEETHPALDLGTAMAISGAAASSNMGDQSIRMLAPTLALLNIRLGYWLPNPARMKGVIQRDSLVAEAAERRRQISIPTNFYLVEEMFSQLDESSAKVYLTDGGHIENLGLYELLKRRCRLIVAVDAEADPAYAFPSLVLLQRYARIDLGVRINDIAWPEIRERSRQYDRDVLASNSDGSIPAATCGCHAVAAAIDYPDAPPGILLYLKSSLTGDENDLIIKYKNDNPSFPHETTGDQFFGEAQFEAYRALGFHAMMNLLTGQDRVPGLVKAKPDGSPLDGQDDKDACALRRARIEAIFRKRGSTGAILNK
jgi:Patatin-like phospholipase